MRSTTKSKWLVDDLFKSEASNGRFEMVAVEDMAVEGAFKDAVRGVSAIAHVATIATFDPDPNNVIPQTIAGVETILKDAAKERSVKSFVYTSSVVAAAAPFADTPFHVTEDSWNDVAVEMAWSPPPYTPDRAMVTYSASKVAAERALWKFVDKENPHFRVNAVLPFTVFGALLHPKQNASTDGWLFSLYHGDNGPWQMIKASMCISSVCYTHRIVFPPPSSFTSPVPIWWTSRDDRRVLTRYHPFVATYIHVEDVAVLHVAAILDGTVANQRLHAWSDSLIWNDPLAIFRKLQPGKKFIDDLPVEGRMQGTVDDNKSRVLLKKWAGRDNPFGLERGVKDALEGPQPA